MADKTNTETTVIGDTQISGIVLAGTYHWTGSSFEQLRVRPLLPVALKPIVRHVLEWLDNAGVRETTICANGSTPALRRALDRSNPGALTIGYYEDGSPRGAAGCVKDAASRSTAQTFIVTDGTSIPTADISRLIATHIGREAELTIVAHRRPSPFSGAPEFCPTGTYVFDRAVLDSIPATSFHDIKENLIPKMYREGRRIELFEVDEVSPRALSAETYLALNRWMIERTIARPDVVQHSDRRSAEVVAHPTAWIEEGAVIVGPVMFGEGVRVHASATVVGPSAIGAGTVIHRGATVARSITWERAIIGEQAFVDGCVVSDGGYVEPGDVLSSVLRVEVPERRNRTLRLHSRKGSLAAPDALARPALS